MGTQHVSGDPTFVQKNNHSAKWIAGNSCRSWNKKGCLIFCNNTRLLISTNYLITYTVVSLVQQSASFLLMFCLVNHFFLQSSLTIQRANGIKMVDVPLHCSPERHINHMAPHRSCKEYWGFQKVEQPFHCSCGWGLIPTCTSTWWLPLVNMKVSIEISCFIMILAPCSDTYCNVVGFERATRATCVAVLCPNTQKGIPKTNIYIYTPYVY